MKRCFLVVGAESSGNRLLGKLLVSAGCIGDDRMNGPFSESLPIDEDPAVVIRSYPHGNEWPDLVGAYQALRDRGYLVQVLIAVRDMYCTIQSQIKSQHHPEPLAEANIRRAYLDIFAQLNQINCGYVMVTYESLVLHDKAQAEVLRALGLSGGIEVIDQNAKYYAC